MQCQTTRTVVEMRGHSAARAAIGLAGLAVLSAVAVGACASLAQAATVRPRVLTLHVSRLAVGGGSAAVVSARVADASRCDLRAHASAPSAPALRVSGPPSCASGRWRGRLLIGPNPLARQQRVTVTLVARNGAEVATRTLAIVVAGRPGALRHAAVPVGVAAVTSGPPAGTATNDTTGQATHEAPAPAPTLAPTSATSSWAGYVVGSPVPVREVSASWVAPSISCAVTGGQISTWVGVDGLGGTGGGASVFQVGTQSTCAAGQTQDAVWWEWFPLNAMQEIAAVAPGDEVSAAVWYGSGPGGSGWWWRLEDDTTGQVYEATAPIAYEGPAATAEWVVEDPLLDYRVPGAYAPLAPFAPITFTQMAMAPGALPISASDAYAMEQGGSLLAEPGVPVVGPGGPTMAVTYQGP